MDNDNKEDLIAWKESYMLGIPAVDEEHRKLVGLCNNLHNAILSNKHDSSKRRDAVKIALRECADYAQTHFTHEEKLMQICNFQGLEKHKNEHTEFRKKILENIQNFEREDFVSSLQFVKFLYDWILYHIAYTDVLYVKPLKESLKGNQPKA